MNGGGGVWGDDCTNSRVVEKTLTTGLFMLSIPTIIVVNLKKLKQLKCNIWATVRKALKLPDIARAS